MKKIVHILLVTFLLVTSGSAFATIKLAISGKVTMKDSTDNSGITVVIQNYTVAGIDFGIDEEVVTNSAGEYTATVEIGDLCEWGICLQISAIPISVTFEKGTLLDSINENIPITLPTAEVNYTMLKSPILGAKTPQICVVDVDTSINANKIVWERDSDSTIVEYRILKSYTLAGSYVKIGSVSQHAESSVFRDSSSHPGGTPKEYYKIVAVYKNGDLSAESYAKTSLNITVSVEELIPSIKLIDNEAIISFDHSMYSKIVVKKALSEARIFSDTVKAYDLSGTYDSYSLLEDAKDELDSTDKEAYYLAVADLKHQCYAGLPSGLKSDSGPYSQSLSNMAEAELVPDALNSTGKNSLKINAVVSKHNITVDIPERGFLNVTDITGRQVLSGNVKEGIFSFKYNQAGVLIVQLLASQNYQGKIIVK